MKIAKTKVKAIISEEDRKNLLELALIKNKVQFVNLLLENNIDLSNFLNDDRIMRLYRNEMVSKNRKIFLFL